MKLYRMLSLVLPGILILAGISSGLIAQHIPTDQLKELELSTAGRCAKAYIEAFNSEDDEALRQLYSRFKSPASLKEEPIEKRLSAIRMAKQMFGKLKIVTVKTNSDFNVEVTAKPGKINMWLRIQIIMEEEQPHFNASMAMGPCAPPETAGTDAGESKDSERTDDTNTKPQTPKRPYPYDEEAVIYKSRDGKVTLAGTLTLPRSGGPHPAVYLIPGGSAFDRDQSIFGHKPFLLWADYLTRRGIAVLRMDDRGVKESTGSKGSAAFDQLVGDILVGVSFLKKHDKVDPERIGVMGHSQGGILAPMAAAQSTDVAFVVMLAGTGMTFADNLAYQQADQGNGTIRINLELTKRLVAFLNAESLHKDLVQECLKQWNQYVTTLPDLHKKEAAAFIEGMRTPLRLFLSTPIGRDSLTYDPANSLRKLKCPVLAVTGDYDAMDVNLPAITKALEQGNNPDYCIMKMPKLNHLFQTSEAKDIGNPAVWANIEETINPDVLALVFEWIKRHTIKY